MDPSDRDEVTQGAALNLQVTIRDRNRNPIVSYDGTQALTTSVWSGGELAAAFAAATTWTTPAAGLILIAISAAQTAANPPGRYQVLTRLSDGGTPVDIWTGYLDILPFPGGGSVPTTDLIVEADIRDRKLLRLDDLPDLITAASELVALRCRRTFQVADLTEAYDGTDRARIWLKRPPINSVSAITINTWSLDNTLGDAWGFDSDTGELFRGNGQADLRFAAWFPRGRQNVLVSYNGGFATIPGPVKRATIVMVKHLADGSKHTGILQSEKIGDYSYTLADLDKIGMPPLAEILLQHFVLDWVT